MRSALSTAALAIVSGVAGLLLGELALRGLWPQPVSYLSIYAHHDTLAYVAMPDQQAFVDTGETRWWLYTDALGLRVPDPDTATDLEAPFILGLGDSFAFGHGVNDDQALFARLRAEGVALPIVNTALPGYGPVQYLQRLSQFIDAPGLSGVLVVTYLGNDFHDVVWSKDVEIREGRLGDPGGLKSWVKRNSHLYRLVSAWLHAVGIGGRGITTLGPMLVTVDAWKDGLLSEARAGLREAFGEIVALCARRQLPLAVVILPQRNAVDPGIRELQVGPLEARGVEFDVELPATLITADLEALGVRPIDATAHLRAGPQPVYFRFDGHLRPAPTASRPGPVPGPGPG